MSLDRNVSLSIVHHEHQTTTDNSLDFTYLLLLSLALAPKVTMDFTLSLSGTIYLGTCDREPGLDAAKQMPVSLHTDLQEMLDNLLPPKSHSDKLFDLELGGERPVVATGLTLKKVAQSDEASRADADAPSGYLSKSLDSRLEIARRKDGRGRPMTPPSSGGGDILNLFSLNTLLPGPGTAGRHRSPVVILKLDQREVAGRHQGVASANFWRASFWHSQTWELRAFCYKGCSAGKMQEERVTPKVVSSDPRKSSFKSRRISRWR